jgi:conserved transporter
MRFLKLPILVSVLFFGMACAQETPKAKLEKTANYPVTIAPDFPDGGINGFRQLVASKFNIDKVNPYQHLPIEYVKKIQQMILQNKPTPDIQLMTIVKFIVEPDGSLSNISAKGENQSFNEEAELAVKAIQVKWIPGEVNGIKIKSLYSMPIKMRVK